MKAHHVILAVVAVTTALALGTNGVSDVHNAANAGAASDTPIVPFNPLEATISSVQDALARGVACTSIVEAFLKRIDSADVSLQAMVTKVADMALERARALDALDPLARGPLHCVPAVLKDNYDVSGVPTSAGVAALAKSTPSTSSHVWEQLESAGAVLLGKTNMPDFAVVGMCTVSSVLGQTLNPYNHSVTTYGSSGGPAVAATASYAVISMGTDTDGSIQNPSSAASIVGLRSTQGLVPTKGVVPLSIFQDVAGPMMRTVADLAAVMEVVVNASLAHYGPQNYTQWLDVNGMAGARIGFAEGVIETQSYPLELVPSPQVIEATRDWMDNIQAVLGATVTTIPNNSTMFGNFFEIVSAAAPHADVCGDGAFHASINAYLASLGPDAPMKTLKDIVDSGLFLKTFDVPEFMQTTVAAPDNWPEWLLSNCTAYLKAKAQAQELVVSFMDAHNLDAIAFPTVNQIVPRFPAFPPPLGWFGTQLISAFSGLPVLVIPGGSAFPDPRTPIGFSLLGRPYAEATLIKLAYAYEQQFQRRYPPPLSTDV